MNRITCVTAVFLGLLVSAICESQTGRWYRPPAGHRRSYGYGGYGGYSGFSSTGAEGASYGAAEMMRASGEAAESKSRAINNLEDARSKHIDNAYKWTQTYWQRKRLGQAEMAKDREKRLASRDRYLSYKKSGAPPRLGPGELDPSTGKLHWPSVLMGDEYARYRATLEELFQVRVRTGATSDLSNKIHGTANDMKSQLRKNIRNMRPNEYLAARNFLDSLAYTD